MRFDKRLKVSPNLLQSQTDCRQCLQFVLIKTLFQAWCCVIEVLHVRLDALYSISPCPNCLAVKHY